jgi:hypothetical protein
MTDLPVSTTQNQHQFADTEAARRQERSAAAASERLPADEKKETHSIFEGEQERSLFPSHQCTTLRDEWQAIQAGFVDSPRASVEKADALVKKTIDTLSSSFADMRNSLENTWEKDREVSTEDLRLAFQNYRSFFQRLLAL